MLNVMFLTADHPFYNATFYKEFDRIYQNDKEINIVGYALVTPGVHKGKKQSKKEMAIKMYNFYGGFDFLRMGMRFAFYKVMNKIALKFFSGHFPGCFSVRHYFMKTGKPIFDVFDVNSPEFIQLLKDKKIDILQTCSIGQVFRKKLLAAPNYGVINVHNGLLPEYRGLFPTFWAMLNYDKQPYTGATVFKMDEGLDTGPIILQEKIKIEPKKSLEDLFYRTRILNAALVYKALLMYTKGEPQFLPNDSANASHFGWPQKEDVKAFRAKGLRLI